jgi:sugar phosphate isomerase/epimerase
MYRRQAYLRCRRSTYFTAILIASVFVTPKMVQSCSNPASNKPDSKIRGVQIGVISYSWRNMPYTAEDVLNYCIQNGFSSIELMGDVAERYAGIPELPFKYKKKNVYTDEQLNSYYTAREKQKVWRTSVSMEAYEALRKMYNDAGVDIHIVKFAPAEWSDEEIDYAFRAAKVLGAKGITNEIGHYACKRLGSFAEKHDMYAIFHNHAQPGDPGFDFEEFLDYSPKNMLNFDAGHYFGATGKHPNELILKLHERIFSLHLKDKTAKDADPPNTNMPWGEGDTPLGDILKLIRDNNWPIHCDIELEYDIPEDSDPVKETLRCLEFCRSILEDK